ncbi:MAG: TetR/AcrR family transcriptional regulator [Brumimicrobium sp.]
MAKSQNSILTKSQELFQQYGYNKTTLTDIAKSVGKVKSAIYYYFSGKEEIFAKIVRIESEQFWSELKKNIEQHATVEEKLHAYIETRVKLMQKISQRYSFLKQEFFELMPIVETNRKKADYEEKEYITKLLVSHKKYKDTQDEIIRFKAEMLVNTIKGLEIQMYVTDEVLIDKKSLPIFSDVLLNGIL